MSFDVPNYRSLNRPEIRDPLTEEQATCLSEALISLICGK